LLSDWLGAAYIILITPVGMVVQKQGEKLYCSLFKDR